MTASQKKKMLRSLLAQSASELAVFGSVLLFVIGMIARAGLYQGHKMNTQLRTMRLALTESYKTAQGNYRYGRNRGEPAGARNTASVMVVEDRISIDSAQALGTRDRFPMMANASGTFSHNLFWTLDFGNEDDLSIFDLFVNGQRFPLTTAAFMRAVVAEGQGGGATISYYYHPSDTFKEAVSLPPCTSPISSPVCWEANCVDHDEHPGCAVAFKKIYNVPPPAGDEWCDGERVLCSGRVNLTERFDLDHDGNADVPAGAALPGDTLADMTGEPNTWRQVFNWQWGRVALAHPRRVLGRRLLLDKPTDGIDIANGVNRMIDLDGDLAPEFVMHNIVNRYPYTTRELRYLDSQEGDIDFGDPNAGLKSRVMMLAETRGPVASDEALYGGTYMLVEEGKLFGADGQFIRDTSRQDHVDIITRFFQLTRNTGRFCTEGRNPQVVDWNAAFTFGSEGEEAIIRVKGVNTLVNPVQACGVTGSHVDGAPITASTCMQVYPEVTCLDVDTNLLYIRSRIDDLRGKRWITRVFTRD